MLFRSYRKRQALASYRTVLGRRLRGVYGKHAHYDAQDVLSTIAAYHLSDRYACYALAMYCDREAFDAHHAAHGEVACNYDRLRRELAADSDVSEVPSIH
jgi:hypothetical protein